MRHSARWAGVLGLMGFLGAVSFVQAQLPPNTPYDGRATLARMRFNSVREPGGCVSPDGLGDGGWSHDYPMSVQGMMKAATSLTKIAAPVDSFVTVTATDPNLLMKYPVVMVTEPGCWNPTELEVAAVRAYLQKGGFMILDDLTFSDATPAHLELSIHRTETWLKRVLPESRIMPVPASDPIFDGFFKVDQKDVPGASGGKAQAELYGVYRENDPSKSLMLIITYRGVMGHHWRHVSGLGSGLGSGESLSGKAYRLGLNVLVYGLSH